MAEKDTEMKLDRIQKLLQQCDDLRAMVSPWERGFLDSVLAQVKRGRTLSTKQVDVVHRVEAKVKKAADGDPEWEAEWTPERARDFKIAVNYYDSSPVRYYSYILDWSLANPDAVAPRNYYKKLVENKYAQKIIKAVTSIPKYDAGSSVMLRATARQGVSYDIWNKLRDSLLFVIEPTGRAVNAAAGCRIYSILPSQSHEVVEIEERYLKKWKQPKTPSKPAEDDDCLF